jgi:hypothetical protein
MTTPSSSKCTRLAALALAAAVAAAAAAPAMSWAREGTRDAQSDGRGAQDREAKQGGERSDRGDRDRRDGGRGRRDDWVGPFGPGWGPPRGDMRPSTPVEWAEVAAYLSRFSPFLIGEVQGMAESEWKERIKRGLTYRYRGLRAMENKDPEGYEQRLAQLAVEDQVFKLMSQWGGADEARQNTIREELRTQVARLVDLDLQERRRRLQKLEDELKSQRDGIERDAKEREGIIDRRVGRFLDWGNKWPPGKNKAKAEGGDAKGGGQGEKREQDKSCDDGRDRKGGD